MGCIYWKNLYFSYRETLDADAEELRRRRLQKFTAEKWDLSKEPLYFIVIGTVLERWPAPKWIFGSLWWYEVRHRGDILILSYNYILVSRTSRIIDRAPFVIHSFHLQMFYLFISASIKNPLFCCPYDFDYDELTTINTYYFIFCTVRTYLLSFSNFFPFIHK